MDCYVELLQDYCVYVALVMYLWHTYVNNHTYFFSNEYLQGFLVNFKSDHAAHPHNRSFMGIIRYIILLVRHTYVLRNIFCIITSRAYVA